MSMVTPEISSDPRPVSEVPATAPSSSASHHAHLWSEIKRHRHFYYFVSPFFVLFAIFGVYPLLFSLYLSFVKWNGLTPIRWVGLGNFSAMLDDDVLLTSLWNTLVIGLIYIPPMLILAFVLACALNAAWLRGKAFFRASIFLPCV